MENTPVSEEKEERSSDDILIDETNDNRIMIRKRVNLFLYSIV